MEISVCVPVRCSDEIVEVELAELMKYQYFQKVLCFGITKMLFHRTETSNPGGGKVIKCEWNIPQISVDCCSKVLSILLSKQYSFHPNQYNDQLIEILLYNDMYQIGTQISNATWGFNVGEYFDLIYFIKQKMPMVNPYDFLKKGGFNFSDSFVDYSFKLYSLNQLDHQVIPDLLPYLGEAILGQFWVSDARYKSILHVLDSIINSCDSHKKIVLMQINDSLIQTMLCKFLRDNNYFCQTGSYQISCGEYQKLYNKTVELIFERLRKLESCEIICLDKIGKMEDFLVDEHGKNDKIKAF